MADPSLEEDKKTLKPMAGTIRRLETTLMLKTWKKLYFTLEDDKLCFYKHHHELEASDVIDLSKVTSVANRTYNPKPKEDERWQIELATADGKVYLCVDSENEMNDLIRNLQRWIDYFVSESSSASKDAAMARDFSISNSERQNAQNLKGYYAALRRGDSSGKPAPAPATAPRVEPVADPKQQILEIDSPARGGMYRTTSGRDLAAAPPTSSSSSGSSTPRKDSDPGSTFSTTDRLELQRDEISALTVRLKQSLDAEAAYRKEIDALKQALAEKDAEMKRQIEELNAGFESKKRSFNFIVNSKDFEIEKLRQEKQKMTDAKVKELEDVVALRDKHISELKSTLNDKEIEILERKESEMNLQAKFESTVTTLTKDSSKRINELSENFDHLKDRYFFALAASHPALANLGASLDLNALYDRCIREQIPLEQWTDWLSQFANGNQRNEGEEENVENF